MWKKKSQFKSPLVRGVQLPGVWFFFAIRYLGEIFTASNIRFEGFKGQDDLPWNLHKYMLIFPQKLTRSIWQKTLGGFSVCKLWYQAGDAFCMYTRARASYIFYVGSLSLRNIMFPCIHDLISLTHVFSDNPHYPLDVVERWHLAFLCLCKLTASGRGGILQRCTLEQVASYIFYVGSLNLRNITVPCSAVVEDIFLCWHVGSNFIPTATTGQQNNGQEINTVMFRPKFQLRVTRWISGTGWVNSGLLSVKHAAALVWQRTFHKQSNLFEGLFYLYVVF